MCKLEHALQRLHTEWQNRNHLKNMLPSTPLHILIRADENDWTITISATIFTIKKGKISSEYDIKLFSSIEMLLQLLDGKAQLTELVTNKQIQSIGSYRNTLLVESIFWLLRPYH